MALYKNAKLRTLSVEGNTASDKAIQKWNSMSAYDRYEVMQKVHNYKDISKRQNACINYVAEFML